MCESVVPLHHCRLSWQGLLAAVLGDGSLCVYPVPCPAHLQHLGQAAPSGSAAPAVDAPLALRLQPVASLAASALSGSLARCCDWHPVAPHAQIVVGCWDGTAAVCQLREPAGDQGRPDVGLQQHGCFVPAAQYLALTCVS